MAFKTITKALLPFLLVGTLAVGTTSCSSLKLGDASNMLGAIMGNPNLSTLASLVQSVGGVDQLLSGGLGTIFAPSNEAFAKLGQETLENLTKPGNKEMLTDILKAHVSPNAISPKDLKKGGTVTSGSGKNFQFNKDGKDLTVGGAKVAGGVETPNGFVYTVDKVLGM